MRVLTPPNGYTVTLIDGLLMMYFLFFVSLNYKHIEVSYNVGNTQIPETSMCDVKPNLCIVMAGFDGTLNFTLDA